VSQTPAPAVCNRHWMATTFQVWPWEEWALKPHVSIVKLK